MAVSLLQRLCLLAACRHSDAFLQPVRPTLHAYCMWVLVSQLRKRPCSPQSCASHTSVPFNLQVHPAPSSPAPHQVGAGAQLSGSGRGPRRSHLRPPPPANVLGGPKTALWRTDRGCLPPGRFISSFFKPCSDFSMSPPPPPSSCLPSFPISNLSAQPEERATGLQGD